MTTETISAAAVRSLPKVLLHDHLDGGLRPATVLELADELARRLPADDEPGIRAWFLQEGTDLPRYLAAFDHTVALLQRPENLRRVARECAEDLAADGVVHAEVRYAPELSTSAGLDVDEVLAAVAAGFDEAPDGITVNLVACIMRQNAVGDAVVAAAVRARRRGLPVVGVDLAGPEVGHGVARHARALRRARAAGLGVTVHAGEARGPASVAEALDHGAQRIGHGVRLVDDLTDDGTPGPVARRVLAGRVTLEVCPSSNRHTGAVPPGTPHPIDRLLRLGFPVTVSTDNRLMSGVSLTDELVGLARTFAWGPDELRSVGLEAVRSAFLLDEPRRADLAARVQAATTALLDRPRPGR